MWESEFTAPNCLCSILCLSTQGNQFLLAIQLKSLQQFQGQAGHWKSISFSSVVQIQFQFEIILPPIQILPEDVCFWLCKPGHLGTVSSCNMDGSELSGSFFIQCTECALCWVLMQSPSDKGMVVSIPYFLHIWSQGAGLYSLHLSPHSLTDLLHLSSALFSFPPIQNPLLQLLFVFS